MYVLNRPRPRKLYNYFIGITEENLNGPLSVSFKCMIRTAVKAKDAHDLKPSFMDELDSFLQLFAKEFSDKKQPINLLD